ncbi:MAG: hypothetical protein IJR35_10895 [Synergistaceae bacterium]|nr:hypothetical protein [Synergistaceae bacterium]
MMMGSMRPGISGFDDFLSKPVNGKELEEMLAKYIPSEKITKGGGDQS